MWLKTVLLFGILAPVLSFKLQNVVDIVGMSKDVVVGLDKVWDLVENQLDPNMPNPMKNKGEERLFRKMNKMNVKLDELSAEVKSVGRVDLFCNKYLLLKISCKVALLIFVRKRSDKEF